MDAVISGSVFAEALGQTWGLVPLLVVGACIGSFLNVCITRLPKGESIVFPPSRCRSCKARLRRWANIPVISYILLRARCAHCGVRISPRYFLVELCAAAMAPACYYRFGPGGLFLARLAFAYALLAAAVIDFETGIIPDIISLSGTAAGLVLSCIALALSIPDWPSPPSSLLGALLGGGVLWATAGGYRAATGRDGLGGGDIKLLAMIGAFAGWDGVPGILFWSALTGSVWGIAIMILRRDASLTTPLPFAPFLCFGALVRMS